MGKSQDAKKIIKGIDQHVRKHKLKIKNELRKDFPNRRDINHWRAEIKAGEERIARLKRRMGKDR